MNTYNVVISVSTTVCIDAESPDDALDAFDEYDIEYEEV